jgi:hypothetical protein
MNVLEHLMPQQCNLLTIFAFSLITPDVTTLFLAFNCHTQIASPSASVSCFAPFPSCMVALAIFSSLFFSLTILYYQYNVHWKACPIIRKSGWLYSAYSCGISVGYILYTAAACRLVIFCIQLRHVGLYTHRLFFYQLFIPSFSPYLLTYLITYLLT